MSNPLKILTHLTASKAAKFSEGLDVNSQKITGLADGTVSSDGINLGQLTSLSSSVKSYVDAANSAQDTATSGLSSSLKSYVDAANSAQDSATSALSSSIKSYVDAANSAQDSATSALSSSVSSSIAGEASARIAEDLTFLKLDGSRSMSGTLNMGNQDIVSAKSGSFSGDLLVNGETTISGNFNVWKSIDDQIGAGMFAYELGAGLYEVDIVARSNGSEGGVWLEAGGTGYPNESASLWVANNGAVDLKASTEFTVYGADYEKILSANLAEGVKVHGDLTISASAPFLTIPTAIVSSSYDVDQAIHDLDAAISGAVSDNTALSSSMKSYVDAQNSAQDSATSALSSSIKSYVDAANSAQDSATSALSSSIKSYVDAANSAQDSATSALSSSVSSSIAAEASARVAEDLTFLKLDGTRSMTGALNMGGQDIVSAKSGSFSGDVTVGGNLQVNGNVTYINSTNLDVTDKLVTIAKGAVNGAAADGAGIQVDGANASLTYDNTSGAWVSNVGLTVEDGAVFQSTMKLSGSAFTNITTPVSGGLFDVSDAIHALDTKVGDNATAISNKYDALRMVVTGTLSSGTATVNLSTVGGLQFAVADMDSVALDIMVDSDNTGYTNDLVAIKMFNDAGSLKVQIDAPATPSAKFRLIAVNEKDGGLA